MMPIRNFLLAPDSFKGTMDAVTVCDRMEEGILAACPEANVRKVPVADGGEGTVDCFHRALGGELFTPEVAGPFGAPVRAPWLCLPGGTPAVIEMASCAGLPLAAPRLDPAAATTFGVGERIRDALRHGWRKILLGLGGSATNDGGAGMAAARGVRFFDEQGNTFTPTGGTLLNIARIDLTALRALLQGCEAIALCDVDNPLCGERGASAVFGPQKGADGELVRLLDAGLAILARRILEAGGPDVLALPGGLAAGGLGAGTVAFLGGVLRPGIDTVLETAGFDASLKWADVVFTGEGRYDSQSARGKVIAGVAKHAAAAGVPVVAIVGDVKDEARLPGLTAVLTINRLLEPFEQAKTHSAQDMRATAEAAARLLTL